MKISVVGLGKLGAPLSAVLASKGFEVIGVDSNRNYVNAIAAGRTPIDEPQLQELIDRCDGRLQATVDAAGAVVATDVTFVVVPTPSDSNGHFSNGYVLKAMESIGAGLRRKSLYHVVVVTSTVMPGSTGTVIQEGLERYSGRIVGSELGLCYNPEFVALGSVVRDMLRPDMILIGESDEKAGAIVASIHMRCCDNHPAIRRMNLVNAELTKISVNTFVTTKISYANMLADLCDRLPGADVDVVTEAVGSDLRIGPKYLRGAVGYGGPCFPRDNIAFAALARSVCARADLAEATDALNRYQTERLLGAIEARYPGTGAIGVLGLSYKPDTAVVEQSQGVTLVDRLVKLGHQVVAYDPKALAAARDFLTCPFDAAPTAADCVRDSSLVVVMTPWPEFRSIPVSAFSRPATRISVIDCWRILPTEVGLSADLVHLGRGAWLTSTTGAWA